MNKDQPRRPKDGDIIELSVLNNKTVSSLKRVEATYISYTSAPEFTTTVAPFRAWRGLRLIVAREPM